MVSVQRVPDDDEAVDAEAKRHGAFHRALQSVAGLADAEQLLGGGVGGFDSTIIPSFGLCRAGGGMRCAGGGSVPRARHNPGGCWGLTLLWRDVSRGGVGHATTQDEESGAGEWSAGSVCRRVWAGAGKAGLSAVVDGGPVAVDGAPELLAADAGPGCRGADGGCRGVFRRRKAPRGPSRVGDGDAGSVAAAGVSAARRGRPAGRAVAAAGSW